jgi:hypothetical protein
MAESLWTRREFLTCARAVAVAVSPPDNVDVHEILFRPARQAL